VIDERIAERRKGVREQRRRSRLRRTVAIVVAVVVVVALVVVERSALVGLEEIRVTGVERLDAEEVREATQLRLGTSTLRLRLGRVEERVTALPEVHAARARRVDPLTVLVEVVERRPSLVVQGDGERVLLDREGVVLARGGQPGLPRIVLDEAPPGPGATAADDPALANAVRGWRGLTGPLRAQVVRYLARGPDDLVLRLDSGIDVRIGRADRLDEKVRAMGVILEDLGDADISEIDVRAPSAPFVVD
jgi:cell division septal protein FtsQ